MGLYYVPILLVTFFFHFTIYVVPFSSSVERAFPQSFWRLCVVWESDFWKVKPEEWMRLARQWGGSLRNWVWESKNNLDLSNYTSYLPTSLLPLFSDPSPSPCCHISPTLICKAVQLPLSCTSPGEFCSSGQSNLLSIFLNKEPSTQRKIMPLP